MRRWLHRKARRCWVYFRRDMRNGMRPPRTEEEMWDWSLR